jgi:hypothetical protein
MKAKITCDGKITGIGYYFCIVKAAKAYDEKARECFGEYARLNFPRKGEQKC